MLSTVDEIFASRLYTDRRGREWVRRLFLPPNIRWVNIVRDRDDIGWPGEKISDAQMRLLIERDQHREVCPGLLECDSHPVWSVAYARLTGGWNALAPYRDLDRDQGFSTHARALDAARALAVRS